MELFTADYGIFAATVLAAVLGLFIGFSGALSFLAATAVGTLVGRFAWMRSGDHFDAMWSQGLCALVVSLLAFGLVRWGVRKVVNGLLRQPADAVFGLLVASVAGFSLSVLAVRLMNASGAVAIRSAIVGQVVAWLGL